MKQSKKVSLCAVVSAIAVAVMLVSYFPYFTYAVPAVAGLFMMIPLIEINPKYAILCYITSAVLSLIIAEPESALLYALLLGYYPILKAVIEKLQKPVLEWAIKIIVFNIAVILVYFGMSFVFKISVDDFGTLGKYGAYVFLGLGNVVFVIYDIAISRMSVMYMMRVHPSVKRLFK
ncbi:MAG: hypothetical protein MJ076_03210 [Clostridia bacterium]|nr:hypothetical protein [Clostridia bacterium]